MAEINFPKVRHMSYIDLKQNIEYRQYICNNVSINGIESVQGFEIIGWYKDFECEIISNSRLR